MNASFVLKMYHEYEEDSIDLGYIKMELPIYPLTEDAWIRTTFEEDKVLLSICPDINLDGETAEKATVKYTDDLERFLTLEAGDVDEGLDPKRTKLIRDICKRVVDHCDKVLE